MNLIFFCIKVYLNVLWNLFSNIYFTPGRLSRPLPELVPRLWPFLRHSIASVRHSALQTFHTLLTLPEDQQSVQPWLPFILQDALRHIFQRSLLEEKPNITKILEKVWNLLLLKAPLEYLVGNSLPWLGVWLCLCMQPSKLPFDSSYLIEAKHRGRVHVSKCYFEIRHEWCVCTMRQHLVVMEQKYLSRFFALMVAFFYSRILNKGKADIALVLHRSRSEMRRTT